MGFWQKVADFLFGPEPGYRTPPQKPQLDQVFVPTRTRRYDAAIPSNTTADWQAWATSANYEIYTAWRRTCFLARDLERNNPHAKAFLRELCANVLGCTGIQCQPKMRMLRGGDPPPLNDTLNQNIKRGWLDWRRRGNFDVTGLLSGYAADKLVLRTLARDGEVLIRLIRGYPNKYRLAIQVLEADCLDIWYNALLDSKTGRRVTMGVELDQYGKPINYHLLKYNQQDLFASNTTMKRTVIPASDIIHLFLHERPTQCRGITWFTTVETKLRMLERYEEATAIAMRISSAKMCFLKQAKDAQQYEGQGQLPTGELLEEISPGEMIKLPPGYEPAPFDPTNPSESYSNFRKTSLRSISSGLGIMYNNLANDLESTNYSSSRYGRTIEIETWRDLQRFMSEDYLQLLFDPFIDQSTLTGAIPGVTEDNVDTVKVSVGWKPRGWAYVDPDKDGKSAANGIDMGLTTRRRELEEQGLDIDEVYEELAEDKKRQDKYGLTFVNSWSRMPAVQSTEEDPGATGPEVAEPVPPAQKNGSKGKSRK